MILYHLYIFYHTKAERSIAMKNLESIFLWEKLQKADKPIYLYGMGDGADKMLAIADAKGIKISGVFASDDFVRGQSFRGFTVEKYSQVKEREGELIALVVFGTVLPEVIDNIIRIAKETELYAPDMPVCGENVFDREFFCLHRDEIEEVYSLLSDELSRKLYENIINYKISGKISYLLNEDIDGFPIDLSHVKTALDGGAYNGDTAEEMLNIMPAIEKIYACEPNKRNIRKLEARLSEDKRVIPVNAILWNEDTALLFSQDGSRASRMGFKKTEETKALRIDSITEGTCGYIKLDVEGAEKEALLGAEKTILESHPKMNISLYHRTEDIFSLPLYIHRKYPFYKLSLRRKTVLPAWEIQLFCEE